MKTPPLCKLTAILVAVVPVALLAACGDRAPQQKPAAETPPATTPASAATTTTGNACPEPPPCGDKCSNHPFVPTDCWTTQYGPAKADIILGKNALSSTNMLYCNGGAYALCFFSGPPYATGKSKAGNAPLPCVLEGDIANCTCQAYTSGPYFVDINAILNRGAYYETVQVCGQDGSNCANIENCGRDGTNKGCEKRTQAPVCKYVQHQNPKDPTVSLIPKADLVSTFSFAMDSDYRIGSTSCPAGPYAGCMTAPCFFKEGAKRPPSDGDPIQCQCPTYNDEYQVGQFREKNDCSIPSEGGTSYVWSAANTVPTDSGQ
jgi:hypothetical protein